MKCRYISIGLILPLIFSITVSAFAKEKNMEKHFYHGRFLSEEHMHPVKNPIRVRIEIKTAPEKIQEQHNLELLATYENPAGSGEIGYWNMRLSHRDIGFFSGSQQIQMGDWLPTDIKPAPLTDANFLIVKPGTRGTYTWLINLNDHEMLEGTHEYQLFLAGNHALPSVISRIAKETQYEKLALTVDTKSNTVTFTYTKPAKAGIQTPTPPVPAATTPDKLNDAREPLTPRLPLGTQVSSLRSCPESGVYECPADAPGVTERRIYISQGRPMPSAFITQPKSGVSGLFGSQEQQEVETTWTLVAYERDGT